MRRLIGEIPLMDIHSVDGTLLMERDTAIDRPVLDHIRDLGRAAGFPQAALGDSPVHGDMTSITGEANYRIVFDREDETEALLDLLRHLQMGAPVLRELQRAREVDYYTYRHVLMTTVLTARMLRDLGASQAEILQAGYAALTHDFGKFRVPRDVLHKPTALTRRELALLRQHPIVGGVLLLYYLGEDGTNVQVALGHHERPDGSGYPHHVQLADRLVRLIAVNDIFDALISPRPYRVEPFDVRGALEFLWGEVKAGRVDEAGCRLLVSYNRRNKPEPWSMTVSDEVRSTPPQENQYGRIADE